jgi:hypothetical protein
LQVRKNITTEKEKKKTPEPPPRAWAHGRIKKKGERYGPEGQALPLIIWA